MSAAVPFSPYSAARLLFFPPPPESERRLLAPTMSPIRCPSIHPSVISPSSLLSSCFSRLPVLEAGCKTGCLIQMETSPAVAAVLLLRQSHISLFSLGACVWSWCVCVCACVCFEAVCDISLAVTGNDLISPLVTRGIQRELHTQTHTHTLTHTVRGKDGEQRLVL